MLRAVHDRAHKVFVNEVAESRVTRDACRFDVVLLSTFFLEGSQESGRHRSRG